MSEHSNHQKKKKKPNNDCHIPLIFLLTYGLHALPSKLSLAIACLIRRGTDTTDKKFN